MLKIASLSLAALLAVASPSFAEIAVQPGPAEVKTCLTPEEAITTAPVGLTLKLTIDAGAKLDMFLKNTEHAGAADKVLFFEKGDTTIFLAFKDTCFVGYGTFPSNMLPRVIGDAETL